MRDMRRKDRQVTDFDRMLDILQGCDCVRLGLADEGAPYIVPLNFGYEAENGTLILYMHSASAGRKIELLENAGMVSFEMDRKHELTEGSCACDFSFYYECVMGTGTVRLLSDRQEKLHGLSRIMEHYSDAGSWHFNDRQVDAVTVIELRVSEWSCKVH